MMKRFILGSFVLIGIVFLVLSNQAIQKEAPISKVPNKTTPSVTILFVGDMMFDRFIREQGERMGYDFIVESVKPLFQDVDIAVGNLEGTITSNQSVSIGTHRDDGLQHFVFTFDPFVAKTLKQMGFTLVSLANNHSLNLGVDGVAQTRQYLSQNTITYFGDPLDASKYATSINKNNIHIAFIGYNQFGSPTAFETEKELDRLATTSDVQIVFAHWGEEYEHNPTYYQQELAHRFIDHGADMVIGAHPHVIQTQETYKNVPIYYSLGNFIFDQYFREDVRCGLVLKVTVEKQALQFTITDVQETTTYLGKNGQTTINECSEV